MTAPAPQDDENGDLQGQVREIAAHLDALAMTSGMGRLAYAARIIRATAWGRPAVDDDDALHEVADMLATGRARSVAQACARAARARPGHNPEATAARLRRKYRQRKNEQKT